MTTPLLEVGGVGVTLERRGAKPLQILCDIAFSLDRGATLGIVGESGSGKSMLALALIGLLPGGARTSGSIRFDGDDLVGLAESALCAIRGRRIGMVFQEPMTALNPAMRVGDQIAESLIWHRGIDRATARRETLSLLDRVRIPDVRTRIDAFPHEMSGGQRQRIAIAIAIAPQPALLIADEPTTALDATTQAEILGILAELVRDGMALILISHDLGVVARATDRLLVLYAGTRFEAGPTAAILRQPLNPYFSGLLAAMPKRRVGPPAARLSSIPGTVPNLASLPPGCRFAPRCPEHIAECDAAEPGWRDLAEGRGVRCIRAAG